MMTRTGTGTVSQFDGRYSDDTETPSRTNPRVPGYESARRAVGAFLRRSPAVMRMAKRLASEEVKAEIAPRSLKIRPGRYFPDGVGRDLPVVVVVATDMTKSHAERLAREFEIAQMMTGSFRPLFVIDSADFAPFRTRGWAVERVFRRDELASVNPDDAYGEYLFSRLRFICEQYRATSVVPIPADCADALAGPLLRLVGAVVRPA